MLYPEIESYHTDFLEVTNNHRLHFQLAGNPKGIPVLFLHGGPGAGLPSGFARFFDPNVFHVIGLDQRGCGLSTPIHNLTHNTSQHLVADLHALREHLNISKWVIFGGSWGATLCLLYAIDAPQHVVSMILRGTFLGRKQDCEWFLSANGGAASLFPEHYARFIRGAPSTDDTDSLCDYFMGEFNSDNELRRRTAVRAWFQWEEKISCLSMPPHYSAANNIPLSKMASMAILECHYLRNNCFLADNFILNNAHIFKHIPGIIVHGRYDTVCNIKQSYLLHQHWENSELNIIPNAGHSTAEPGISAALCQATRQVAKFLK